MIYFDNAATSFPKPEVVYETFDGAMRNLAFNAGRGVHSASTKAMNEIISLKSSLLDLVNADNVHYETLLFDSATTSSNIVINGLALMDTSNVYVTPFEHNAIMRPLHKLSIDKGFKIHVIPFNDDFSINWTELLHTFVDYPPNFLFSTVLGNAYGNLIPYDSLIKEVKKYDCMTVFDASQALGILDLDFAKSDIDVLIFAGHKNLYGPLGIGGVIKKSNIVLNPYLLGGNGINSKELVVEKQDEVGSPNIPAIAALNTAIKWTDVQGKQLREGLDKLYEVAYSKLSKIYGINIISPIPSEVSTSIISFTVDEYDSDEVATILSEDFDIAVRSGYHCNPLLDKFYDVSASKGVIRVSLSFFSTLDDLDVLHKALESL